MIINYHVSWIIKVVHIIETTYVKQKQTFNKNKFIMAYEIIYSNALRKLSIRNLLILIAKTS